MPLKWVEGQKCGFPYYVTENKPLREVRFHPNGVVGSGDVSSTMETLISPSGHFRIHYQTDGYNAIPTYDRNHNGTPDYLEFVANSFDRAWAIEIDSLGFQPPPDANGQPKAVYDIYCVNLAGSQLYGYTDFDPLQDIPDLPGLNFTSDIYLSTQFTFVIYEGVTDPVVLDSMAIAVTAAHEFNHALQLGYRIWGQVTSDGQLNIPDLWFIEATATYMEEVVANQVNDYYQYLPDFFQTTHLSLTHTPDVNRYINRLYGEVVWFIQLGELWGKDITRRLWERVKSVDPTQALRDEFQQRNRSLPEMINTLATWMYFCGERSQPGRFFPEAPNYPAPPVHNWNVYTQPSDSPITWQISLQTNAFAYVQAVVNTEQQIWVTVHPEPPPLATGGVLFGDSPRVFSAGGLNKLITTPGIPIPMAIGRYALEGNTLSENLVTAEIRMELDFPAGIRVFPNRIDFTEGITVLSVAPIDGEGFVRFYTVNGNLALEIPFVNAQGVLSIPLSQYAHQLSSGVYLVQVVSPRQSAPLTLQKILIIQ